VTYGEEISCESKNNQMKITATIKTNSKQSKLEEIAPNTTYKINVKAKPREGKANDEAMTVLSKHFRVPKTSIQIVQGLKSKHKIFEIPIQIPLEESSSKTVSHKI